MSDNEDLLGDDLEDHSLADYNLGNDEEDQLLADDFESGSTQNVPSSIEDFREPEDMVPSDYSAHGIEYGPQPVQYQPISESESVVPNIVVEVPNLPPPHSTYAPYEPRHYEAEHSVPPAMPAAPTESPQIVPSEIVATIPSDINRERFISERPVGAQRLPQVRDIPDSLDKVVIAGGRHARGSWRPHHYARTPHPYRRNNMHRPNFLRNSFPPQQVRPLPPIPDIRLDPIPFPPLPLIRMEILNDVRPSFQPDRPDFNLPLNVLRPESDLPRPGLDLPRPGLDMLRPVLEIARPGLDRPLMDMQRPPIDMARPRMDMARPRMDMARPRMDMARPRMDMPRPGMDMPRPQFQQFQRFGFREERPMFNQVRQPFERPVYFPRQQFQQRFGAPPAAKEPEVRMLPVSLPAGLAPKKVLINPHFKGTFQPPVEGLSIPTYIPTRIQKPPISPTLESKFGPIKDIDDAAERFIAEQRNALARAAGRKFARRSPQRYIEDTTIEIENDLARRPPFPPRRRSDDDLLRRQEEFIHANRAGLRRRMRSPSPAPAPRRSASPRREPEPRRRPANDEDSEYKRRVREQESMRERVLRAKEVRRRKNAAAYIRQQQDKGKEDKDQPKDVPVDTKPVQAVDKPTEKVEAKPAPIDKPKEEATKPDTTRKTPEREWTPELNKLPVKKDAEVNSTCEEALTPPRAGSDDEIDLILAIDGILSEDEDDLLKDDDVKEDKRKKKPEPPKPKVADLRAKLPPKEPSKPRQKITFNEEKEQKKKKEKSPARRAVVSSTRADDSEPDKKAAKTKLKQDASTNKSRQRIIFENKNTPKAEKPKPEKAAERPSFSNRRVILQRKATKDSKSVFSRIEITSDPTKPNPGIFSRAVRTIERPENSRIVVRNEPEVEYDSGSDEEVERSQEIGVVAVVANLPHGMTDTRLKTLAGDVQSLNLDKEERTAKITFKTTDAADMFKKKFNNKMVAASRLTVTLE